MRVHQLQLFPIVGGFNPSEIKISVELDQFPQVGVKLKKYLSCHHLVFLDACSIFLGLWGVFLSSKTAKIMKLNGPVMARKLNGKALQFLYNPTTPRQKIPKTCTMCTLEKEELKLLDESSSEDSVSEVYIYKHQSLNCKIQVLVAEAS